MQKIETKLCRLMQPKKTQLLKLLSVSLLTGTGLAGCSSVSKQTDTEIPQEMTLEYGSPFEAEVEAFFPAEQVDQIEDFKADLSRGELEDGKDYLKCQTFSALLFWSEGGKKHEQEITIHVQDTTAPKLETDHIETSLNQKPDYDSILVYNDYSLVSIETDDSAVDYSKVGEYELKAAAKDSSGNKTEDIVTVQVREEPLAALEDEFEIDNSENLNQEADGDQMSESNQNAVSDQTEQESNADQSIQDESDSYVSEDLPDALVSPLIEDLENAQNAAEPESDQNSVQEQQTEPVLTPSDNGGPYTVQGIPIVNKKYGLDPSYAPGENQEALEHLYLLIGDMQEMGMDIQNGYSGFRSYDLQSQLYSNYAARDGAAAADTYSARPGFSEHQTGLAFDVKNYNGNLLQTPAEADWIAQNAWRYGFIVRYTADKQAITGYMAEPWHLRYIGDRAKEIYDSDLCLEEFLGVEGGDYR